MKIKLLALIFTICVISGFLYLRHIGIFNGNTYKIRTSKAIDKKELKIFQGFYSINRDNDSILFEYPGVLIYENGRKKKKIKTDHGENDFLITYKDSLYYQFRHFKTNCRMIDNFDFSFSLTNDTLYLDMMIRGTNWADFKRGFNKISDSRYLRTNVPVDSVGFIYNGLELIKR